MSPSSFLVNPASQAERKRILAEASRATTYNKLAQSTDPDQAGGRYVTGANIVPGQHSHVNYPPLPEGNPWSSGPQPGIEPPTGVEVDALEPCGTFVEIQRSLASSEAQQGLTWSGPACEEDDAIPSASTRDADTASSYSLHLDAELGPKRSVAQTLQRLGSFSNSALEQEDTGPPALRGGLVGAEAEQPSSASVLPSTIKRRSFSK